MALLQLVCQFFFLFTLATPSTPLTPGSKIGQRNFSIHVVEIQYFLSPPFSSSLSSFWLNFGNGIATISLSFFFFFFTLGTPRTPFTPGSRIGKRNFGIHVAEIQHFLSPPFSSFLSYFWLNFGNGNTEIQSLSLKSQISFNSFYNVN